MSHIPSIVLLVFLHGSLISVAWRDNPYEPDFMEQEVTFHLYSWGLTPATIEYSCPSVCLSVCLCTR